MIRMSTPSASRRQALAHVVVVEGLSATVLQNAVAPVLATVQLVPSL
jgi:hypothetical protein